jgi:hypothetical protein
MRSRSRSRSPSLFLPFLSSFIPTTYLFILILVFYLNCPGFTSIEPHAAPVQSIRSASCHLDLNLIRR